MTARRLTTVPSTQPSVTQVNGHNKTHKRDTDPGVNAIQMAPLLLDHYYVMSMVLGGCCANVWAYEQLLMINPRIGSALTFSQMLFITAQSLPSFLTRGEGQWFPQLKPRQVPLEQWALQVLLLTSGSLLNNWAFAYDVPLTLLIVFRSAGLGVSMLFGFAFLRKQYSMVQVLSVVLVTVGVILATLSKPKAATSSFSSLSELVPSIDIPKYITGISMIVASLFCTGLLGLLQERTYKKYGPCWKEGVFYTHCLSLPVFLFLRSDIKQGMLSLSTNGSAALSLLILGGNLVTQLVCVSGVNKLSSQVSSVSTNLVLTVRKALSLCLSVWWFGNGWNSQLGVGAVMVFIGSLMFSTNSDNKKGDEKKD